MNIEYIRHELFRLRKRHNANRLAYILVILGCNNTTYCNSLSDIEVLGVMAEPEHLSGITISAVDWNHLSSSMSTFFRSKERYRTISMLVERSARQLADIVLFLVACGDAQSVLRNVQKALRSSLALAYKKRIF